MNHGTMPGDIFAETVDQAAGDAAPIARANERLRRNAGGAIILVGAARSGRRTQGPHALPAAPSLPRGAGQDGEPMAKDDAPAESAGLGLGPFSAMLEYGSPEDASLFREVIGKRRGGIAPEDAVTVSAQTGQLRSLQVELFERLWRGLCEQLAQGHLIATGCEPLKFDVPRRRISPAHWKWPNAALPFGQATTEVDPPSVLFGDVLLADVRIARPGEAVGSDDAAPRASGPKKKRGRPRADAERAAIRAEHDRFYSDHPDANDKSINDHLRRFLKKPNVGETVIRDLLAQLKRERHKSIK